MNQRTHRTSRRWWALAAAATTTLAFAVPTGTALAKKDADEWVTICHRTNATKNPYVQITVKASAVDGINGKGEGQGDHYGQHTGPVWEPGMPNGGEWGDIIPPVPGAHDGLNWTDAGRAIFDAGCAIVAPVDDDEDDDGTPGAQDPDDDNDGTPDTTDPDDDNDGTPDTTDPDADPDATRTARPMRRTPTTMATALPTPPIPTTTATAPLRTRATRTRMRTGRRTRRTPTTTETAPPTPATPTATAMA